MRIVCVHGAGGGGWEWDIWSRVFAARGLDILAADLEPSESGLASTTFDDYLAQVLAWCQSGSESVPFPIVLIGASLGGLLALAAAARVDATALLLINPMPPEGMDDGKANSLPAIMPWRSERSISGTRRAMPDADDAACLFAWQRWRDESGLALGQARRGIDIEIPSCPVMLMASDGDDEIPPAISRALATRCLADFVSLPDSSHVGPLLGRQAARAAGQAADWLVSLNASGSEIALNSRPRSTPGRPSERHDGCAA